MLPIFDALPPYMGGKRRLLGNIFRDLPSPVDAPVLADAFLGGGSVSLYAKVRGYRVVCNDLGERSVIVGRALIANEGVRLDAADELRLFDPPADRSRWVEQRLAPDVVTPPHAAFLCGAMEVARRTPGERGWLLRLLCVRYLLDQRPMRNFGAKTYVHRVAAEDWDRLNMTGSYAGFVRRMGLTHPRALVAELAEKINRGVFATGQQHEAVQGDAVAFLRACGADVAVLDPPYAGTTGYETALRPLDEMLLGGPVAPEASVFSRKDSRDQLLELLDAAEAVPVVVLTYGGPVFDLAALEAMLGRTRRRVVTQSVVYGHLRALSTEQQAAQNRELILVGWR